MGDNSHLLHAPRGGAGIRIRTMSALQTRIPRQDLQASLDFIASDKPEHIGKVLAHAPGFEEMYREIIYFRYHPEEAIGMFSEALRVLDENTVKYMIEEMKQEQVEKDNKLAEKDSKLTDTKQALTEKENELADTKQELEKLCRLLAEK